MTKDNLDTLANEAWLGRLRLVKPKQKAKIGFAYEPWHHLAICDDIVILYLWDYRAIVAVHKLEDLAENFETVRIIDNGKPLVLSGLLSQESIDILAPVLLKYQDLPICSKETPITLENAKQQAEDALASLDRSVIETDDSSTIFVSKSLQFPDKLYMFTKQSNMNPDKDMITDSNVYSGRAKYFSITARCAIINEWLNNKV